MLNSKAIRIAVLATCLAIGHVDAVSAQKIQTVQELLDDCESPGLAEMFCLGVVAGASAVLGANCAAAVADGGATNHFRAEHVGTFGAGQQAFINWARANPARWGQPGVFGMILALEQTFPCGS